MLLRLHFIIVILFLFASVLYIANTLIFLIFNKKKLLKSKVSYVYNLSLIGVYLIFLFFLVSMAYGMDHVSKVILKFNGKRSTFIVTTDNPLWIIKASARESYTGNVVKVETNVPAGKEYIAHITPEHAEYSKAILEGFLGIKLKIKKKQKWWLLFSSLMITALFMSLFYYPRCKLKGKSFLNCYKESVNSLIHRMNFSIPLLWRTTLVILLSFYELAVTYYLTLGINWSFIYFFFYNLPVIAYFLVLFIPRSMLRIIDFKITLQPFWNWEWILLGGSAFLIFLSFLSVSSGWSYFKRFFQYGVLLSIVAISGIYRNTKVKRSWLKYVVFVMYMFILGIIAVISRDFGVVSIVIFVSIYQFILYLLPDKFRTHYFVFLISALYIGVVLVIWRYGPIIIYHKLAGISKAFDISLLNIPLKRIELYQLPVIVSDYRQIVMSNYLFLMGGYFGNGFFSHLSLPYLKILGILFSDSPFALLSFAGGMIYVFIFYLLKFIFYALIFVAVEEQVIPRRVFNLRLALYPVTLLFILFDVFSFMGTLRLLPFTGVPTIFASTATSLTVIGIIIWLSILGLEYEGR